MASARILIDCTPVSATTPMTGIPRVLFEYIKWGYRFGFANNTVVLPVYVNADGIFDARVNLPGWVSVAPGADPITQEGADFRRRKRRPLEALATSVGRPLAQIVEAPLARIGLDGGVTRLKSAYRRWLRAADAKLVSTYGVEIGPGDVLFMPAYWHDQSPDVYRRAQARGAQIVPLVHDILPITRPEDYHAPWRDEFRAFVSQTLSFSDHVMCVSLATLADVTTFMREEGLDLPSCSVRRHGMDRFQDNSDTSIDQRLRSVLKGTDFNVLTVGSIEPKKNHALLLQACERLWSAGQRFNLIVIGGKGWLSDPVTTALRRHPQRGCRLFWFDRASDLDLACAYQACGLVVLPSKAEGFGLPLLEALAHKRPVLASDIPPFKEVGRAFVDYFDSNSAGSLETALGSLLADPARLAELADRAGRFTWPNWEAVVSESMQLLVSLSGKSTTAPVTEELHHSGHVAFSR